MSLRPTPCDPVPVQTARVAHAAFPKGHPYLRLREALGHFYTDADFADLFPSRGQPALAPWRLALVTVLQFVEDLTDRQAAAAVRSRIDWKYLLGLELEDPGFDFSVLSEFRTRLVQAGATERLLDLLLDRCRERDLLKAGGRQRTDSTHVLAAIRTLNALECAAETLRAALNALATAAPEWLGPQLRSQWSAWSERYGARMEETRFPQRPADRQAFIRQVGQDGYALLEAVYTTAPAALWQLPTVQVLREVWLQRYYREDGQVQWREEAARPPASARLESPYDPEARYGSKRTVTWSGYVAHLSEHCPPDGPHLITHVDTTPGGVPDGERTAAIHQGLAAKGLLPQEHYVDGAYLDAELQVQSQQQYGVVLIGPPRPDVSWQTRQGTGFGNDAFAVDWEEQQVTCPRGQVTRAWYPTRNGRGQPVIRVKFPATVCAACASREQCTRAQRDGRGLVLRPQAQHAALQQARAQFPAADWQAKYQVRAGVEGTISQGVRRCGLRLCRYIGEAKTHLQHVATAAAINLTRLAAWFADTRREQTRRSALTRLALAA